MNVKTNPKSFYRYVRSISKTKDVIGPLKDNEGQVVNDDRTMCGLLNDFFTSVFTHERQNIPEVIKRFTRDDDEELKNIVVDEEIIKKKFCQLKDGKAPGDDGLVTKFLKEVVNSIATPLQMIFSKSLATGVVPEDWKIANVTPIFRKGSKQVPGNYRPVSFTSHVGKLLESILKDGMISHLRK